MKKKQAVLFGTLLLTAAAFSTVLGGCKKDGRVTIQVLTYKREAVNTMEALAKKFESENPDIKVQLDAPNDAVTILKTRLVKEDPPDVAMIGGDRAYADFVDADMMVDLTGYDGLEHVKEVYLDMAKQLELRKKDGQFCIPYASNAAGILYNRDMFSKNGWETPATWDELMALCQTIRDAGETPFYFMLKDSWTAITPFNAIAANTTDPDIYTQVSLGETTFADHYGEALTKMDELVAFGQEDPFAYGYNDGCTAFGNGESAMLLQGNWAIPQILSTNPDMNIGSFTLPVKDNAGETQLVSGVDVLFSVMKEEHKEESLRFIDFMMQEENVKQYMKEQQAISCIKGDYPIPDALSEMESYWEEQMVIDFPDHHYPAELPASDILQGYLMNHKKDAFLSRFDTEWQKTNRDLIAALKDQQSK